MQLSLQEMSQGAISQWLPDFYKRAKGFEPVPAQATILGIMAPDLKGYFAIVGYSDGILEINQGYLSADARHSRLSYLAMKLLQEQVKKAGFKKIVLKASRSLRAYTRFMSDLGFKPESIIFSKEV